MKKNLLALITIFFINSSILGASEKHCSHLSKWKENWKYKKCMAGQSISKEKKTKSFLSDINKKYKSLREKVPKTGVDALK